MPATGSPTTRSERACGRRTAPTGVRGWRRPGGHLLAQYPRLAGRQPVRPRRRRLRQRWPEFARSLGVVVRRAGNPRPRPVRRRGLGIGTDLRRPAPIDPLATLPSKASLSGRISWQPTADFSVSSSYQQNEYPGSPRIGFASLSLNYRVANIPTFVNLSRSVGRTSATTLLVGFSLSFGNDIQVSATGGYGSGSAPDGRFSGAVYASQPLRENPGDIGWQVLAQRSPAGSTPMPPARSGPGTASRASR